MRTKVRLVLSFFVAMVALLQVPALAGTSTACRGLEAYAIDIVMALPASDMEDLFAIMEVPVDRIRPSQAAEAASLLDEWALALEDMPRRDVPRAARDYHDALIQYLGTTSMLYTAISTTGLFGALAYVDAMEEIAADLDAAIVAGERECGADWPFDSDTSSGEV